jgi:hypothetical protein
MPLHLPKTVFNRLLFGGLLACGLFLLLPGCGPDYKARGAVKGRVTVGKKPLTTGTVMFYGKNGITASAHIDTEGNYDMKDAPLGECQVTVTVPAMSPDPSVRARLKGKGPKMPGADMKNPEDTSPPLPSAPSVPKEIVPIDSKYSNTETSGLNFKVEKGEQTYNIDL